MNNQLPSLRTEWLGRRFIRFDELGSTNEYLKEHAPGLPHGAAVTATRQTAGKGRLGRGWSGSDDNGLALSLLLRGLDTRDLPRLPLLAGLGAVYALESITETKFALKWSNDVLVGGKKLCGILCESRIASDGIYAVAGFGVNLTQEQKDFESLGLVYATSLQLATGIIVPGLRLAAEICNQFERVFENYRENGFDMIKESYKKRCVTLGKQVRVITGNGEQTGIALDIAEDGALICDIGGEIVHVRAGEASVRGIYGYA